MLRVLLAHIDTVPVNEHPIGLFVKLINQVFDVLHTEARLRDTCFNYE